MSTGSERAYQTLRSGILSGTYPPGAKLSEVALADSLRASRTPIREALRQLARDGLVEVAPHRGARVVRWDDDDLEDLFSLRAALEGYGAARAALRRTPEQLDRMDQLVTAMDALPTGGATEAAVPEGESAVATRTRLNNELHQEVVAAAASVRLKESLGALIHVPLIMRTFGAYSPQATVRSQQQHHDLVDAIRVGDAEFARAVMTAHILGAYRELDRRPRSDTGSDTEET